MSGPGEAGPAMQTGANTVDLRGMRVDEATRVSRDRGREVLSF